jgi:hypothetical protein
MTSDQISGIIRALVSAIGGYFIGKGVVDADTVSSLGGALATIATAVWSFQSKKGA